MAMLLEPPQNSTRLRRRGFGGFLVGRLGTIAFLAILAAVTNLSAAEGPVDDGSDHWAFVAPQQAALPPVGGSGSSHPIDRFLDAKLAAAGLEPVAAANRATLLRRVTLDLTGLPPTRDDLRAFLADTAPDAYDRLVDRLLDSPAYGERWGRHWMDVWRYADWHGRRHVPDVWNSAPQVFRWRDWIVASLNADTGYDEMVRCMLASDELHPGDRDAGVATGYLVRNWYALNPNDWMRSTVEHVGKAFLGLTTNCAHCHDHKFDPFTQEDYFRLRAFFEPMGLRQDRLPGEADPGPFQPYDYSVLRRVERRGTVMVYDRAADAPTWFYTDGDERNRDLARGPVPPGVPAFLAGGRQPSIEPISLPPPAFNPILDEPVAAAFRADAVAAIEVANRSLEEVYPLGDGVGLARKTAAAAALGRATAALVSLDARLAAERLRYGSALPDQVVAAAEAATAAERHAAEQSALETLLVAEGALATARAKPETDAARPAEVAAAAAAIEKAQGAVEAARGAAMRPADGAYTRIAAAYPATSTGRRAALARWITDRANPLAARVAVNHVWMRHFHEPLLSSVFDFGRAGAAPSHPQLLDWLAVEFMENGWRMKPLHRLIVTSAAYRRASAEPAPAGGAEGGGATSAGKDPENRLLKRMNVGRMEAEVVRDAILHLAGTLDRTIGGMELENAVALTTFRRSLYYSCQPEEDGRSPFAAVFDCADAGDCYRRSRTILPQQGLALANSDLVHAASARVAADLRAGLPAAQQDDRRAFVAAAFEHLLGRAPQTEEMAACLDWLGEEGRGPAGHPEPVEPEARRAGLVRVLFNHNDFVAIR
jgi:hypothetical protein